MGERDGRCLLWVGASPARQLRQRVGRIVDGTVMIPLLRNGHSGAAGLARSSAYRHGGATHDTYRGRQSVKLLRGVMDKLLLTTLEAATVLGISRSKLYELLTSGQLPSVRIGACRRVPAEAVHSFVNDLQDRRRLNPNVSQNGGA